MVFLKFNKSLAKISNSASGKFASSKISSISSSKISVKIAPSFSKRSNISSMASSSKSKW